MSPPCAPTYIHQWFCCDGNIYVAPNKPRHALYPIFFAIQSNHLITREISYSILWVYLVCVWCVFGVFARINHVRKNNNSKQVWIGCKCVYSHQFPCIEEYWNVPGYTWPWVMCHTPLWPVLFYRSRKSISKYHILIALGSFNFPCYCFELCVLVIVCDMNKICKII